MAVSWDLVRDHLRVRYRIASDEKDCLGIDFSILDGNGALEQRVKVEHGAAFGAGWIAVLAAIAPASRINAAAALEINARLAVGAVAVLGDLAYARAAMAIDSLDFAGLERAIEAMAREAVRLRGVAGLVVESAGVFQAFEE